MALPFKEIIDLGHEYFDGMSNIGGSMVAFFPLETHEHYHIITSGKLSMEGARSSCRSIAARTSTSRAIS